MIKQKGFTLVDLGIVFVVVSLMLGGAFKGEALLETAKANHLIKKNQTFETAYLTLEHCYNAEPGDKSASQILGRMVIVM